MPENQASLAGRGQIVTGQLVQDLHVRSAYREQREVLSGLQLAENHGDHGDTMATCVESHIVPAVFGTTNKAGRRT
jgi:hypothetical protein